MPNERRFLGRVRLLHRVRNRAAHRRPIVRDNVNVIHQNCLVVARAVNADLAAYLKKEKAITRAYAQRPEA